MVSGLTLVTVLIVILCSLRLVIPSCPFAEHIDAKHRFAKGRGHGKPFGHHTRQWKRLKTVYEHPDPEHFYDNYVRLSKPLLIKGGAADWPAIKKWTNISYINELSGDQQHTVNWKKIYDYDRYHAIRVDMKMSEFTDKFNDHDLYMDATIPTGFHKDVHWPHSLGCKFFLKRVKQLAIMMNNGRSSSDVHIDATDTYFVQATGRRLWLLTPPTSVKKIYSGHPHLIDHSGVSILDQSRIDLEKFPRVSELEIYAGVLHPGDIIYVPEGWYHQVVTNGSPNIAIVAFLNILFCEYHNKRRDDVSHVEACVDDVRRKKPSSLKCKAFPKTPISIDQLLRERDIRNRGAFNGHGEIRNTTERIMRYHKVLLDGSKLPAIGLTLTGMSANALEEGRVLEQALIEGINLFVTAPNDGSEEAMGAILQSRPKLRKNVILMTYLSLSAAKSRDSVFKSIDTSLSNLKTSKLDFVLLKAPYCVPDYYKGACVRNDLQQSWIDAWRALEHLQTIGKIRFLGLSDFSLVEIKQIASIAKVPITIVRARFDLYFRNHKLRRYCRSHNIHFMGRSILGGRWKKEQPNFSVNRDIFKEYDVQRAAFQYKISVHVVIYDWAIKKNTVVCPRVNDPLHVRINIKAIDSESNEKIDHILSVDEFDNEDRTGLYAPYARSSDFDEDGEDEEDEITSNSSTYYSRPSMYQKKLDDMKKVREFHSKDYSQFTYTDEKDFEMFPNYMTKG